MSAEDEQRLSTMMVEIRRFLTVATEYKCERLTDPKDITVSNLIGALDEVMDSRARRVEPPIPMLLWCPECGQRHVDRGAFAEKAHHTHACQECGMTWRPAIVATVGMLFLPGFKDDEGLDR